MTDTPDAPDLAGLLSGQGFVMEVKKPDEPEWVRLVKPHELISGYPGHGTVECACGEWNANPLGHVPTTKEEFDFLDDHLKANPSFFEHAVTFRLREYLDENLGLRQGAETLITAADVVLGDNHQHITNNTERFPDPNLGELAHAAWLMQYVLAFDAAKYVGPEPEPEPEPFKTRWFVVKEEGRYGSRCCRGWSIWYTAKDHVPRGDARQFNDPHEAVIDGFDVLAMLEHPLSGGMKTYRSQRAAMREVFRHTGGDTDYNTVRVIP